MKVTRSSIAKVTEAVLSLGWRKATCYLDANTVVKATALHKQHKNARSTTLLLTVGRPNHAERKYIATLLKAGVPLPCKRIIPKHWPKK